MLLRWLFVLGALTILCFEAADVVAQLTTRLTCQTITVDQLNSIMQGRWGFKVLDVLSGEDAYKADDGLHCWVYTMTTQGKIKLAVTTEAVNGKPYMTIGLGTASP
jgi:hypothetical protein